MLFPSPPGPMAASLRRPAGAALRSAAAGCRPLPPAPRRPSPTHPPTHPAAGAAWRRAPHPDPATPLPFAARGLCSGAAAEDAVDAVVVGAGVVGLAVARALALGGREVIVLDKEGAIGTETSSRNSEVIHAGIYYPKGSLKARMCVRGKHLLYDFCESHGVPYKRTGKLIVARGADQVARLASIRESAEANGVEDLAFLSREEARELEPEVECDAALLSPSTGIVDSHSMMLALLGGAEEHGAALALHSRVVGGRPVAGGIEVRVADDDEGGEYAVAAKLVVNCAGLGAWGVARALGGVPEPSIPGRHLARGCYFSLGGRSPFSHLVYPVPVEGGLGVHATVDLAGQCKFGPDVEWVDEVDYTIDPSRADAFYEQIRRYWPALPDGALQPDYTGIRPKVAGRGMPAGDFVVQGPEVHGVNGLIHMYGIESPGLTSALALGEHVADMAAAMES